jgi:DNA-binding XRE family transcriptional regulator
MLHRPLIRRVRRQLGLTQTQLAARVGASRKAVIYQWESHKRCPSPLFWQRIQNLGATSDDQ